MMTCNATITTGFVSFFGFGLYTLVLVTLFRPWCLWFVVFDLFAVAVTMFHTLLICTLSRKHCLDTRWQVLLESVRL